MTRKTLALSLGLVALLSGLGAMPPRAAALDDAHAAKAEAAIDKAIAYLREAQNDQGAWTPRPGPAVTGLIVAGMLRSPDVDRADPTIDRALRYILDHQQPDGGFYDAYLKNYNTSICLMALGRVGDDPQVRAAVEQAHRFLRELQWDETKTGPSGQRLTRDHPYFGGAGYGDSKHGRPDGSNTNIMIAGLYDSGFDCTDPLVQRAAVYVSRLQGARTNDLLADKIVNDGGMIYATSIDANNVGVPQTRIDDAQTERRKQGEPYTTPLVTYGSMTYAGYMSYLYAQLDRTDPRVVAARAWISSHYTVDENPRMGQKSYYYYMHFLARALRANGERTIATSDGKAHDWANDVIDALVQRQREDGSWSNEVDRWMEDDPNIATAYALIALQVALGR